jgi:hypothetical protein
MRSDVIVTPVFRVLATAAACGLAVALVASCSQTEAGTPSPTAGGGTSAGGANTAPKVSNPKNLKAHPACELLTTAQLADLGATATPKTSTSLWGETKCQWINGDIGVFLSPDTTQGKGLAITYQNKAAAPAFEPLAIAGYPAVVTGKQAIECAVAVGVSDTQMFLIDLTVTGAKRANHDDPCALAQKVGADVLSNLPAGQ